MKMHMTSVNRSSLFPITHRIRDPQYIRLSGAVEALDFIHDAWNGDSVAHNSGSLGAGALEQLQHARVVQQQLRHGCLQHLPPACAAPEILHRLPVTTKKHQIPLDTLLQTLGILDGYRHT